LFRQPLHSRDVSYVTLKYVPESCLLILEHIEPTPFADIVSVHLKAVVFIIQVVSQHSVADAPADGVELIIVDVGRSADRLFAEGDTILVLS